MPNISRTPTKILQPTMAGNPGRGENPTAGGQSTATMPPLGTETASQASGTEVRDRVRSKDPPKPGGNRGERLSTSDAIHQTEEFSLANQGKSGQGTNNSLNLIIDSDTDLEGNDVLRTQGIMTNHRIEAMQILEAYVQLL